MIRELVLQFKLGSVRPAYFRDKYGVDILQRGGNAVYISGEEAMAQVRLRAARMDVSDAPVALGAAWAIALWLRSTGAPVEPLKHCCCAVLLFKNHLSRVAIA